MTPPTRRAPLAPLLTLAPLLLLGWLAAIVGAGCAAPRARPPLRVASDLDNRPFAWVDERGVARGRDVEMMEALAAALGRPLEWRRMPFEQLLPAVERAEVDLACATLGVTPERAERVLFTRPYFATAIAVVVRAGPGEPRALADLAGRAVLAGAGTTSERAVLERLPRARLEAGDKGRTTAERLSAGEVDAAVLDGPAAEALVERSGGRLVRLAEPLARELYALALPRSAHELRAALDRELARLERDGALAELDAAHGLAPDRAGEP